MSTPPPANPYADAQAANPYAEQVATSQWTATSPPPPKKNSKGRSTAIGLGVMILALGGLFAATEMGDKASTASVGDCVHNSGTDSKPDVKVVDCKSATADFKVLKTLDSDNMDDCNNVPGVAAEYSESAGNGDSLLLCLGKNTP